MENPLRQIKHFTRRSPRLALTAALVVLLSGGTGVYAGLGGFTAPREEVNLDAGLVGWWKLNGNANDSSPTGAHGTVNGATLAPDRFGNANSAYSFAGTTGQKISFPSSGALNSLNTFTTSGWYKIDPASSSYAMLAIKYASDTKCSFQIMRASSSNNLFYHYCDGTTGPRKGGINNNVINNQWHHVVMSYDGATVRAYVDGVSDGSWAFAGPLYANNYPVELGHRQGQYLTIGSFDDIRIYDRALNPSEIQTLHKGFGSEGAGRVQVADTQKGLVGHWKLDGDAMDSSAYRNHGTVNGASLTTDRHGKPNGAYSFDGGDDHIYAPHNASLNQSGNFTLAAWVYPLDRGSFYMVMTKQPSAGVGTNMPGNYEMRLEATSGKIQFLFESPVAAVNSFTGTAAVPLNQWSHIAVAFTSSNKVELFLNGALDATIGTTLSSAVTNSNPLLIGKRQDGFFFKGKIDDPRIYNRALPLSDIKQLYDQYDANVSVSSLQKQLVGHWSFDGDAKDRTPYRNHGTPVNGPVLAADRRGRANSAYSFDGANDYISIPSSVSLSTASISIWAKRVGTGGGTYSRMLGWNGFRLEIAELGANLSVYTPNMGWKQTGQGLGSEWNNIVVTADGTNLRVYFNGSLLQTYASAISLSGNAFVASAYDNSSRFNGILDDVRIYSRALSAAEVQALYDTY